MTLIAAWNEDGTPCLLGDVIISATGVATGESCRLPTRDDLEELIPPAWGIRIVDTRQKVYKVADTFALGWAGSEANARFIVRGLLDAFRYRSPSVVEVRTWLQDNGNVGGKECIILGWVVDHGEPVCFRWSTSEPGKLRSGGPFVEGSGAPYFEEILHPTTVVVVAGAPSVFQALGRAANLLGHEVLYGRTLLGLFGGGFQLAIVDAGRFWIVPSVTYVFMYAREENGALSFGRWHRALKIEYDYGVVQTMVVSQPGHGPARVEMYHALPVTEDFLYAGPTGLSLESIYYCVWFDILFENGLRGEQIAVMGNGGKEPWLRIEHRAAVRTGPKRS
jgi:hypothetical protein